MAKRGRKKRVDILNESDIVDVETSKDVSKTLRQEEKDEKPSSNRLLESEDAKDQISEEPISSDEVIAPPSFRNPLERNLGHGFSDIEFTYPNLEGYWATDKDIPSFLRHRYEYCKREWIKDYDLIFPYKQPGTGSNPNGRVTFQGHTLLVASKEIANTKSEFYRNRIVDPREAIKGNLSKQEMRARGLEC